MARVDLAALYRAHNAKLVGFLRRRLGVREAAAPDLAQEAYLKLFTAGDGCDVKDERSFLFAAAANLAIDHVRVERRRQELREEAAHWLTGDPQAIDAERQIAARSDLAWLRGALTEMPARRRRVLILYRINGLTQAQIAAELGLGLTTVRADLSAAIGALVDARRRVYGDGD